MYLGIDLGTSALKVILMDDDQNLLGEKNIPFEVNCPQAMLLIYPKIHFFLYLILSAWGIVYL